MDTGIISTPREAPSRSSARSLLILDDDAPFRNRLSRAMEKRGFDVVAASSLSEARDIIREVNPPFAVLDLRVDDGNGLDLVPMIRDRRPDARVIVLTGYGNIATAVAAVKAGAVDYISKPADADQIESALLANDDRPLPPPPDNPMSADRVRWEHIQRVFEQCDRNVSETARRLRMHRRTLQRILNKHAPRP